MTVLEAYKKGYSVKIMDDVPRMTYKVWVNMLNSRINMIDVRWVVAELFVIKGMKAVGELRPGHYMYHAIIWYIRDYEVV